MDIWITVGLFLLGLALIVKGGDLFVDAAVWMAEVSGMPCFLIGATVVSFATTLPELMVSVMGVLEGEVDLAVGNAVGSVTANLGLILGISVVCMPSAARRKQMAAKAVLMVLAAAVPWWICRDGVLSISQSLLLLILFTVFVWENLREARGSVGRRKSGALKGNETSRRRGLIMVSKFLLGIAGIVAGSQLLIDKGSAIALLLGVPSSVIGVTMVAVGTSLPELVTAIAAIAKREASMSVGNIIGANVIDLTLILPVCSLLSGGRLEIGPQTVTQDLPVCLLAALIAVAPPLWKEKFYRWQGAVLLALYGVYLVRLI